MWITSSGDPLAQLILKAWRYVNVAASYTAGRGRARGCASKRAFELLHLARRTARRSPAASSQRVRGVDRDAVKLRSGGRARSSGHRRPRVRWARTCRRRSTRCRGCARRGRDCARDLARGEEAATAEWSCNLDPDEGVAGGEHAERHDVAAGGVDDDGRRVENKVRRRRDERAGGDREPQRHRRRGRGGAEAERSARADRILPCSRTRRTRSSQPRFGSHAQVEFGGDRSAGDGERDAGADGCGWRREVDAEIALRGDPKAAAALCAASVAADRSAPPVPSHSRRRRQGRGRAGRCRQTRGWSRGRRRGRGRRRRRAPSRCRPTGHTRCAARRPAGGGRPAEFVAVASASRSTSSARSKAARGAAPSGGVTISAPLAFGPRCRRRGRRGARGRSSASGARRR